MGAAIIGAVELRRLLCLCGGQGRGEPLLFKGNDFSQTDIEPALKD